LELELEDRAGLGTSIKDEEFRIGLWWHLRRRTKWRICEV